MNDCSQNMTANHYHEVANSQGHTPEQVAQAKILDSISDYNRSKENREDNGDDEEGIGLICKIEHCPAKNLLVGCSGRIMAIYLHGVNSNKLRFEMAQT